MFFSPHFVSFSSVFALWSDCVNTLILIYVSLSFYSFFSGSLILCMKKKLKEEVDYITISEKNSMDFFFCFWMLLSCIA